MASKTLHGALWKLCLDFRPIATKKKHACCLAHPNLWEGVQAQDWRRVVSIP